MNFFNEKQLLTHQQGIYGLESGLRAGARYSFGSGLELGVDMDYGVSKVFDNALNISIARIAFFDAGIVLAKLFGSCPW